VLLYWVTAGLAAIAAVIQGWQWVAASRFPIHQRTRNAGYLPPVTLLKPVKDADPRLSACLESWLTQDYSGPVECLFAVQSPDDPACEVIRTLIASHPGCDARLVLCPHRSGPNAKVSKLADLESMARHPVLVISDADVLAPPDLLRQVVAPLQDSGVGLVNCFYRLANPTTPAMRCEAVGVNADFWSQVLQSRTLREQSFALGAVMAVRDSDLAAIGGFRPLVHHLADDYQLGQRIHALGRRIVLCSVPVDCWDPPADWATAWTHQLRWNRTIRVCQPIPYLFSILGNATLWSLLHLASAFEYRQALWTAIAGLIWRSSVAQLLYARMCTGHQRWMAPWWIWIKDLQAALLWAAAFLGNRIIWRGDRFTVGTDGRLTRISNPSQT
jgi:ceramide glucosyltransferase